MGNETFYGDGLRCDMSLISHHQSHLVPDYFTVSLVDRFGKNGFCRLKRAVGIAEYSFIKFYIS